MDSLKYYIERFFGVIQLKNQTDLTIVLSNNDLNDLSYAVVNGADTLKLVLRDSLPIIIEPHRYEFLRFDSAPSHKFLQKLPEQEILHDDTNFFNYIAVDSDAQKVNFGHNRRIFYNKGIYDKEQRGCRFRGW